MPFSHTDHRPGFTSLEVILTVVIIGVLATFTFSLSLRFTQKHNLSNGSVLVTQALARARSLALSGTRDSPWGYSVEHGVIYQGRTFAMRDPAFDEEFFLPPDIEKTGLADVSFSPLMGTPSASGTIVLSIPGESRTVAIAVTPDGLVEDASDLVTVCSAGETMQTSQSLLPQLLAAGNTEGPCEGSVGGGGSSASGGGSSSDPVTVRGMVLLGSSLPGSLSLSGNARLTVATEGSVQVNSTDAAAVQLGGNAVLTVPTLIIGGTPGSSVSGNASIVGMVLNGVAPVTDPLASLPIPVPAETPFPRAQVGGNTTRILDPGTYDGGISVSGNALVTLNPGTYYLDGGLSVSGNGRLMGADVMLYCTNGVFKLNGNGAVSLTPRTAGPYEGVTFFQDRASTQNVQITGNGNLNLQGILYARDAGFTLSGNGSSDMIGTGIVGSSLEITGNGAFWIQ